MKIPLWAKISIGIGIPLAVLATYWFTRPPKTTVTIEVSGGFAYVAPTGSDNHLNIAYLNSWVLNEDTNGDGVAEEVCNVKQLGTHLMVVTGDIVDWEPKSSPKPPIEFPLDRVTVRFPQIESENQPLTAGRDKWTNAPYEPVDPDKPDHWKNLKWVPSLKEYHGGTIDPNWPTLVNGWMELRGGEIIGSTPSEAAYKKAHFDFKKNNVSQYKVTLTDHTTYSIVLPTASLPSGNLEMTLSYKDGATGYTKVVIKPKSKKIELALTGQHPKGNMADGDPLKDYCTFYQLLQPRPPATEFLTPYYIKAPSLVATTGPSSNKSAPSPGFFCNGDWF